MGSAKTRRPGTRLASSDFLAEAPLVVNWIREPLDLVVEAQAEPGDHASSFAG